MIQTRSGGSILKNAVNFSLTCKLQKSYFYLENKLFHNFFLSVITFEMILLINPKSRRHCLMISFINAKNPNTFSEMMMS